MINFNNTQQAFISKSNKELKWGYRLFTIMASPRLQNISQKLAKLAIKLKLPIYGIVKKTLFIQFVGGETLNKCLPVVETMGKHNVKSILDYSVEGKEDEADILEALEETIRSIKNAGNTKSIPFSVFKPTAMSKSSILKKASSGEPLSSEDKVEVQKLKDRINTLCKTAFEADTSILIDAEDFSYQKIIDDTADEMMAIYNKEKAIVFNTWQMYRHDRLEHLKQTYQKSVKGNYYLGAKFVRGAYMEKERELAEQNGVPSPIQPNIEATANAYNAALKFSIEHLDRISIFNGTHNAESNKLLCELMEAKGLRRNDKRIWFSQLYGMSDHISFNLAATGYNVAKYLPYGPVKHVLPYLLRRAEENSSVEGQSNRELSLIKAELKRRKSGQ
ncbi:MAG: proline dehydrogenase family protein [Bacteroidota bacterium]|nr:proline dehydrogenase family protein [Bacteroidota bacterium]